MIFNWRDAAIQVLTIWWRLTKPCTIGVRGLVWNDAGELLMVRHSYDGRGWFLPGGGHRGGESPDETLVREMREETGLEVAVTGLVGVYFYTGQFKRDHIYVFECRTVGGAFRRVGGEIADIDWFQTDAMPANSMFGMDRILVDWRSGKAGFGRMTAARAKRGDDW